MTEAELMKGTDLQNWLAVSSLNHGQTLWAAVHRLHYEAYRAALVGAAIDDTASPYKKVTDNGKA